MQGTQNLTSNIELLVNYACYLGLENEISINQDGQGGFVEAGRGQDMKLAAVDALVRACWNATGITNEQKDVVKAAMKRTYEHYNDVDADEADSLSRRFLRFLDRDRSNDCFIKAFEWMNITGKKFEDLEITTNCEQIERIRFFSTFSQTFSRRRFTPGVLRRLVGLTPSLERQRAEMAAIRSISQSIFAAGAENYAKNMSEFAVGSHMKLEAPLAQRVGEAVDAVQPELFRRNQESTHYVPEESTDGLAHHHSRMDGVLFSHILFCPEEGFTGVQTENFPDGPVSYLKILPPGKRGEHLCTYLFRTLAHWFTCTLPHRTLDFIPYQLRKRSEDEAIRERANVAKWVSAAKSGGLIDAKAIDLSQASS